MRKHNPADTLLILQIGKRAKDLTGQTRELIDWCLDIETTHSNAPLRLADLLAADSADFLHDVIGIWDSLNRQTGQLENCFLPRYAQPVAPRGWDCVEETQAEYSLAEYDITLTPAYGRDYRSAKAALDDLKAGKDFVFNAFGHPHSGRACSIRDLAGVRSFRIRYSKLTKLTVVSAKEAGL